MKNPKICQMNFKTDAAHQRLIETRASELGMSTSAYIRTCEELGGELLIHHPLLAKGNRCDFRKLAASVGKTLVKLFLKIITECGNGAD